MSIEVAPPSFVRLPKPELTCLHIDRIGDAFVRMLVVATMIGLTCQSL